MVRKSYSAALLAALLLLVGASMPAVPVHGQEQATVLLKDGSKVFGPTILLGGIAEIKSSDADVAKQLKQVVVGQAPLPGGSRTITVGHVEVRLRQAGFYTGAITVETDTDDARVSVVVPVSTKSLSVADESSEADSVLTVWRAKAEIQRLSPVISGALERVSVPKNSFYGTPLQDLDVITSMRARRSIRAGEIIVSEVVEESPQVARGQPVIIRAIAGAVQVDSIGVANSDGFVGERIAVTNQQSGQVVYGVVQSSQLVEVRVGP